MNDMTYGERAVGLTFNPGGNPDVDQTKRAYADVIDMMNDLRIACAPGSEQARLASIAITEAQTAQMWAVKALTWKD
jgi:hypothetical protein